MAIVLYQRSPVSREMSSILCTKKKSLDTAQYKEQQIQVYRKPAKKRKPNVTYQVENAIPQSVLDAITRFQKEGRQHSETFAYWDGFIESGNVLVRPLRADREANFLTHIHAVMETVPYFVLAGRINYSRYTSVYIAEMIQLEEREPLMYRHTMERGCCS